MNKNQHLSANIPAAKNKIQIKEEQIMCDPKELGHLIHQISQEITSMKLRDVKVYKKSRQVFDFEKTTNRCFTFPINRFLVGC